MRSIYNKSIFTPFSTRDGIYYCSIKSSGKYINLPLDSQSFELEYKTEYRLQYKKLLSQSEYQLVLEEMRLDAYANRLDYNLETRIFNKMDGSIFYRLNAESNLTVKLESGKAKIVESTDLMFKYDSTFRNQATPNLKMKVKVLPKLLKKHFHLKTDNDIMLLTLYLVCAFSGKKIGHPILILTGSKGSGKSQVARLIGSIIDPQDTDLVAIPKTRDDLALRLYSSYLVLLDNISYIKKDFSDILAMAVTNGTYTKRALYKNTEELRLNLRSLIILTGIDVVAKESDVLDRSILLELERLNPEEILTESELLDEFNKDLPKILGCCLKLLALAENDDIPVQVPKTRMADAFELMIRVGRALDYDDEDTAGILWENQSHINHIAISDDTVGACIVSLMNERERFSGSVTQFLDELKKVAEAHHIDRAVMPKQPNVLSRKLNALRSNLESEYGIVYTIKNTGSFRQIEIWWQE